MTKPRRLVCIPNDPLEAYQAAGYPDLTGYFNPDNTFDEVYCVSPQESREYDMYGMHVLPTHPLAFAQRVMDLDADCVRAYDIPAGQVACATRVKGVPVICSVHDVNPARCPGPLPAADYFLAISNAVENFLIEKGAPPESILKFANRVDMDVFRPLRDEARRQAFEKRFPGKHRVLLVGRLSEQKNQDTLLKALALLGEDYTVLFVGKGDRQPYLDLAKTLGIAARCAYVESVPNEELADYYNFCDCFCTPSRWEGFGIVFIEALACEAVIVTSDKAPMNEFIKDGESGVLVRDYENPAALADAIRRAVTDQDLRARLKAKARLAAEPFSVKAVAAKEREYYEMAMARREECPFLRAPKHAPAKGEGPRIFKLSPEFEKQWENVVHNSPDAWFYHAYAEQILLEEALLAQTLSFLLEWRGDIVAILPLQRTPWRPTHAASTLMGPAGLAMRKELSSADRAEVEALVYPLLRAYCEKLGIQTVEFPLPPLTPTAVANWDKTNPLLKYGFENISTVTTVVDLTKSEDDIFANFTHGHRQPIRKAKALGVEIFRATGPTAVDDYYALHVETYTRTGVQPHPKAYFDSIFRHFVQSNKAHWFMARYQGRLIGATNIATFGEGSLYWTGAYAKEALDNGAGRLLQWEAIRYAKSLGLRYHETGEIFPDAAPNTKEHGLSKYKRNFGGMIVPFHKGLLRTGGK